MRVNVYEPRGDTEPVQVKNTTGLVRRDVANRGNDIPGNTDIRDVGSIPQAVEHEAALQDDVNRRF